MWIEILLTIHNKYFYAIQKLIFCIRRARHTMWIEILRIQITNMNNKYKNKYFVTGEPGIQSGLKYYAYK